MMNKDIHIIDDDFDFSTLGNDTTITNPQASAENSQSVTKSKEDTPKEKHSGHDKFSKLDSLRHSFDTHREIKKTEYLGGLFPRGGITVIAGPAGVGKTLFMQRLFHDLSKGGEIFGGFAHEKTPLKSIILAGEFGENGLAERAQEFNWHSDKNFVEVVDFITFEENGISFNLCEKEGQSNIEHLAASKPDLMFIDSLGIFFGGKENDNSDLIKVFRFLVRLARVHNIAIVIIHHSRKRLASEQEKPLTLDDVIGGNVIARYSHRVIVIEYNRLREANTVTCLKSWGKFFDMFTYKVEKDFYGNNPYLAIDLNPEEIEEISLPEQSRKKERKTQTKSSEPDWKSILIAYLKGRGSQGATIDEIMSILGYDEQKDRNAMKMRLKRMTDDKELIKPKDKRGIYALPETSYTSREELTLNFEPDTEVIETIEKG